MTAIVVLMLIAATLSLAAVATLVYGIKKGNTWLDKHITLTRWSTHIFIALLGTSAGVTAFCALIMVLNNVDINPF